MTETAEFLDALPTLNLSEIRESLKAKEAELKEIIVERRKSIDALRQLERVVDVAQNGAKPRVPRKRRGTAAEKTNASKDASPLTLRQRAAVYLSANGATTFRALSEDLGCSTPPLYKLAQDDPWFVKQGLYLTLTELGKRGTQ